MLEVGLALLGKIIFPLKISPLPMFLLWGVEEQFEEGEIKRRLNREKAGSEKVLYFATCSS